MIIDEAQRHPPLFNYLQSQADKAAPGTFLVSGSNNFLLINSVSQSLAGRAGILHLLPLSGEELGPRLDDPDWESAAFQGFYPRVRANGLPADLFAKDYLATYVERDVRLVRNIHNLAEFQRFLQLCAGRSGQLLNLVSLSQDAGISVNTVKDWLGLLEASFLIFFLRPWNESYNKRLVKSPKLYWHDTSLLCRLLDVRKADDLRFHPLRGAVFENLLVSDRYKRHSHAGESPRLWYWRDSGGIEIDLVEQQGARTLFWEAKAGQTVNNDFFKHIETVGELAGIPASQRIVCYGGDGDQQRSNARAVGWRQLLAAPE
jgi:predicted AAA+ superfamily ATPase